MSYNITSTSDYNQFKRDLPGQREVSEKKVKLLMKSINKRNKLYLFPIIVTPKKNGFFQIIDGQHRHEAALRMKATLYYTIDHNSEKDDIMIVHGARYNWQISDFINFYANKGLPDYLEIKDLMKLNPHKNNCFSVIHNTLKAFNCLPNSRKNASLKDGTMKVKNMKIAKEFIETTFPKCVEMNKITKSPSRKLLSNLFFKSSYLCALALCYKHMTGKEYIELWKCIFRDYKKFTNTNSTIEAAEQFKSSFNFSKKTNRFDFGKIWKALSDEKLTNDE